MGWVGRRRACDSRSSPLEHGPRTTRNCARAVGASDTRLVAAIQRGSEMSVGVDCVPLAACSTRLFLTGGRGRHATRPLAADPRTQWPKRVTPEPWTAGTEYAPNEYGRRPVEAVLATLPIPFGT